MITGAALVAPMGEIELSLFPGTSLADLIARLNQYLSEAYSKTSSDDAAAAWAYHRAYKAVYIRMSAAPVQSELVDQSSIQFDANQAERFKRMSDDALASYLNIISGGDTVVLNPSSTVHIKTKFTW